MSLCVWTAGILWHLWRLPILEGLIHFSYTVHFWAQNRLRGCHKPVSSVLCAFVREGYIHCVYCTSSANLCMYVLYYVDTAVYQACPVIHPKP